MQDVENESFINCQPTIDTLCKTWKDQTKLDDVGIILRGKTQKKNI